MRYNAINLIRKGAESLRENGDGGTAYALHELANNLLLVMQDKASMEQFRSCYVASGSEMLDLDAAFPTSAS